MESPAGTNDYSLPDSTTHKGSPAPSIETDTPIVPFAIAQAVHEEASRWLKTDLPRSWISLLTRRANAIYAHNPRFRQTIRRKGNAGRDYLWAFTRHWLAGLLYHRCYDLYTRLPRGYTAGQPPP